MLKTLKIAVTLFWLSAVSFSQAAHSAWIFPEKLRAVHFWQAKGNGVDGSYIHNSLRGLDLSRLDTDMRRISLQGFNSIVFWVNWGDLMPGIYNVDNTGDWWTNGVTAVLDVQLRPNDPNNYEARLRKVVSSAKAHGLSVVILPFSGTNPELYSDAGASPSSRLCSWPYGIYYKPLASQCPPGGNPNTQYNFAMFQDNNLFGMYTVFLRRLGYVLKDEENVYGYVMAWETGFSDGNYSVSHVELMASNLKANNPSKRVGHYPKPGSDAAMYYVNGTDFVAIGWYGQGSYGLLNNHILYTANQSTAAGAPTNFPIFVYEYGYNDGLACTNPYLCRTDDYSNPVSEYSVGRSNQAAFVNIIASELEADNRIKGYSYWGLQDNDLWQGQTRGMGLIDAYGLAKPAWNTFGEILRTPSISGLGLGCANGACIWITGKRFAGEFENATVFPGYCHVDFYAPNWSAHLQSVKADYCSDTEITLTIPTWIRAQYAGVNLTVVNKYNRWAAPTYLALH